MKKDKKAIKYNSIIAKRTNEFHFPVRKLVNSFFDVVGNKIYRAPRKVSLFNSEILKVVINHVLCCISVILIVALSIFGNSNETKWSLFALDEEFSTDTQL